MGCHEIHRNTLEDDALFSEWRCRDRYPLFGRIFLHQIMSFAAPLGVGITSDGEYFDIEVNESMTSKEAVAALNETMVDGVEVTSYVKLPDKAKTAMSIVAAADYRLSYKEGYESPFSTEEWKRIVKERFLDSPQFTIIKKTKKSERK